MKARKQHGQKRTLGKGLAIVLFTVAFCFQFVLVNFISPRTVYAGPVDYAFQAAQIELNAKTAIHVLTRCFLYHKDMHKGSYGDTKHAETLQGDTDYWNEKRKMAIGILIDYSGLKADKAGEGPNNKQIDCNTIGHIESLLKILGFDSLRDFHELVYPKASAGGDCDGDYCDIASNADSQEDLEKLLFDRLGPRQKGSSNSFPLSGAAGYLAAMKTFEDGECKGKFVDEDTYGDALEGERASGTFNEVGDDGVRVDPAHKYITFDSDNEVQETGLNRFFGGGDPSCDSLAEFASARADDMERYVNDKEADCEDDPTLTYCDEPESGDPLGNTTDDGEDGSSTGTDPSCESEGGVMSWVMCPVANMIEVATDWIDTQIQALLEVDSSYYTDPKLKQAFANIRNLAYIILVPIVLVMVIGTAMGFDFVSAYTVKRALPRLAVAVIFMALSYNICVFLIGFFNELGSAVQGIIGAPFGGIEALEATDFFRGNLATGIVTGAGATVGLLLILWLFGGTLLLFAAVAYLVLVLRQLFIVVLMLAAPLAILAWIFPGNDRFWKLWWGSFSKLLMMFPLIMALITVGRIFAFVIDIDEGIPSKLMSLIAIIIPYAFIPFTFKFAGGMFATVAGMANDRSKGLFDRQRKSRAGKLERTAGGNMFKSANERTRLGRMASRLNTVGAGAMNVNKAGLRPRNWRANMSTALGSNTNSEIERVSKEDQDYATWKGDDDLNRAAAESHDEASLRTALQRADARAVARGDQARFSSPAEMNQAVARVERVRKKMSTDAFRRMTTGSALAGGTAYDTAGEAWEAVARAGGNDDAATATLVAQGRSALMQAGRVDQGGAGFGTTLGEVRRMQEELRQTGTVSQQSLTDATEAITAGAIDSSSAGQAVYGKPGSARQLAEAHSRRIQSIGDGIAAGTHTQRDMDQALASAMGVYDAMGQASPQNARAFSDALMGSQFVDPGNGTSIDVLSLAQLRSSNEGFIQMRKDYATGTAAQAAAAAGRAPAAGAPPAPPAGGPPPGPIGSDRRIKKNINYLCTTSENVRLYSFQYFWSDEIYVGVMAQDILSSHPEAISVDDYGFYMVDYSLLGLEMVTLDDWQRQYTKR